MYSSLRSGPSKYDDDRDAEKSQESIGGKFYLAVLIYDNSLNQIELF